MAKDRLGTRGIDNRRVGKVYYHHGVNYLGRYPLPRLRCVMSDGAEIL
jgi:hypothetical protein